MNLFPFYGKLFLMSAIDSKLPINPVGQVVQPQPSAAPTTDEKVYALLILRNVLVGAAVVLGSFSFVWACLVNPVWVLGIVGSVVLGTLGLLIDTKTPMGLPSIFNTPFVPTQPLGLFNSGASCWINSAFQLFANLPNAAQLAEQHRGKIGSQEQTPLQKALASYSLEHQANLEGKTENRVSSVKTLDLWNWLYQITASATFPNGPIDGPGGTTQQDPIDFFREVMPNLPLYQGVETVGDDDSVLETTDQSKNEPLQYIPLHITGVSFKEMFASFFKDKFTTDSDEAAPVQKRRIRNFTAEPEHFFIHLARYKDIPNLQAPILGQRPSFLTTKITNPVEVPPSLTLDVQGQTVSYKCAGLVVHGGAISRGHYVSYVFKHGNWWCINDDLAYKVGEAYIKNQMSHGYIYYFAREGVQA